MVRGMINAHAVRLCYPYYFDTSSGNSSVINTDDPIFYFIIICVYGKWHISMAQGEYNTVIKLYFDTVSGKLAFVPAHLSIYALYEDRNPVTIYRTFQHPPFLRKRTSKIRFQLLSIDSARSTARQLFNGNSFVFPEREKEQDDSAYIENYFRFH